VAVAAMPPAKAVAAEAAPQVGGANGAAGLARPDDMGRFGRFGGKYVPETLMHALTELEAAFHALATDDEFQVMITDCFSFFSGAKSSSSSRGFVRLVGRFVWE
jgi:tryptophan synthase beta chain